MDTNDPTYERQTKRRYRAHVAAGHVTLDVRVERAGLVRHLVDRGVLAPGEAPTVPELAAHVSHVLASAIARPA